MTAEKHWEIYRNKISLTMGNSEYWDEFESRKSFIEGFKAATKQFNLEDIKEAIEMARESDCSNYEYYGSCENYYTEEQIIQKLLNK